ncbi:MAG TPA: transcriptional regulator [Lysinibacillus sp.]|uniref:Transcriptional regulator n=1 Tax=Lysinibacillus fusiformis TaxID=28031 RepID=A0A2I0UZS5_9BACI|nr:MULTISPECIES: BTAD domain-containing putative transcriptional regulator [Lysinibacillus]HBT70741.1 transcriptional regulator [Lysinibacillus sp.]KUF36172.1 transcriptional regulator [Lysinibacillus sp. F5]MEE3806443.1 BTAD domain-containing putative transcriptional regulator [Lysinibacillus fusiformis]PKU51550.1 transcriptional regulator [Lysinibacillus fusiformis]SCY38907.1 transcriptional regulator [Lysinibacillus sp. SG9]
MTDIIIQSKCMAPSPSTHCINRAALMKTLKKSHHHTCTFIHSGAGYGKTTILTQFLSNEANKFSWYSISEEDDNLLPFLRHLFFSIQRAVPNFGPTFDEWNQLSRFPKMEELNRWYKLFVNCLCSIEEPFLIVIDDFHLVDHVFSINYFMEKVIEFAPPAIHFIIASRTLPNWDIMRKLKLQKKWLVINEDELAFSTEEIAVFFEEYVDVHLSDAEMAKILEITEGWAISLSLLAEQWHHVSLDYWLMISPNDLFTYLSEEVYSRMTATEQETILKLAIFPTFSAELLEDFYGFEMAQMLNTLSQRHLFIQPVTTDGLYRFHALFSRFLEMKWRQHTSCYTDLHKQAAFYYMERHNIQAVLYHAFKTNDHDFCGELLQRHAEPLVRAGQFEWLLEKINRFTVQEKDTFYRLYYFDGECHRYRAYYERAKQSYDKCAMIAQQQQDHLFMTKSQAGLAHIYLDTIQPALAEPYLEKALELAKYTPLLKEELLELQRQYAENLVNLGKAKGAQLFMEDVALPADVMQRANVDVRVLLRTGQLREAKELLAQRLELPPQLVATHRESELLAAFVYALLGQGKEAWYAAQHGIRRGLREKSIFIEAVGYIRKAHALLLMDFPDYQGACQAYEKALTLLNAINISRVKAEPYMGLAIAKHYLGDIVAAKKYLALGLRETEQVQDAWMTGLILLAEVKIILSQQETERAKQLVRKAQQLFQECGDRNGLMHVLFYQSVIAFQENNRDQFHPYFQQFAQLCLANGYDYFLQRKMILGPSDRMIFYELLHFSQTGGVEHAAILTLRSYFQVEDSINYPHDAIQINLFGSLSLIRAQRKLEDKEWQRDKSKELFVYLYCHRNRFTPKEEIAQALWPDRTVESLDRDFKVVLNTLLKVLEPQRHARQESFFIQRKNNMYQLQNIAFLQIDVERFHYYYNLGMEEFDPQLSDEWLLLAEASYPDALYAEKKQIDWLTQDREKLQFLYIEVLERLAQNATRQQQYKKAIHYAEKIIGEDALWEEGYRLLMYSYYQLQNRSLAYKWYEKCVQQLQSELNTTPMESTMAVYDLIMG